MLKLYDAELLIVRDPPAEFVTADAVGAPFDCVLLVQADWDGFEADNANEMVPTGVREIEVLSRGDIESWLAEAVIDLRIVLDSTADAEPENDSKLLTDIVVNLETDNVIVSELV